MTTETTTIESATETVTIDKSSAIALTTRAREMSEDAAITAIDSPEMLSYAGEELGKVKRLQKDVEETRTSITKPLNEALRAVNALFKAPADFLTNAETVLKREVLRYTDEQERIAAEAKRIADAAAAVERHRLAQIAQKAADAEHAAAKEAQFAANKAREAAAAGDAVAAAAAQALADTALAAAVEAQAVQQEAAMTAEVVTYTPTAIAPAKVSGISGRVNYVAEVLDFAALVKAVAAGTAPIECLQANDSFLGAQARAFKKAGPLYPGVDCKANRAISTRAA